jgi:sensor histidine kinase YesM
MVIRMISTLSHNLRIFNKRGSFIPNHQRELKEIRTTIKALKMSIKETEEEIKDQEIKEKKLKKITKLGGFPKEEDDD